MKRDLMTIKDRIKDIQRHLTSNPGLQDTFELNQMLERAIIETCEPDIEPEKCSRCGKTKSEQLEESNCGHFCKPELHKSKLKQKFIADYADFRNGQSPAVFLPNGDYFFVISEDQSKLVARILNEWLNESTLNTSVEER